MNYFLIFILFLGVFSETILKNNQCTCKQIQSEDDCLQLTKETCSWADNKCTIRSTETYCGIQTDCTVSGCAKDTTCVPFTGCSAYSIKTHEDCQTISKLCTSNGEQCVGLGQCSDYGTSIGCIIDYKSNYCYWNENTNKCETVISECEQLPNTLKTDKECRTQISNCTAGKESGCVSSGLTCAEQGWESACVTDSSQTTQCIWQDNKCLDYVCSNSPITLTTHDDCWKYKTNCTLSDTKTGCIDLKECPLYTIEEQCKIGTNTNCKWIVDKCLDAICENAPDSYISNSMCQSFLSTCTVDDDQKGCKTRYPSCVEIPNRYQCQFSSTGQQCFWNDTSCIDYSCENATVTSVTPTKCNLFKNTCTSNDNLVCAQKTCSQGEQQSICTSLSNCIWQDSKCLSYNCATAAATLTTEEQCSTYKTGCTTNGAGCVTKGQCTDATVQAACSKDINGQECIWSSSKCKLKECSDIVKTSHKDCNAALSTCTTNGTTCVPLTECEASTSPDTCILGSNGPCLWVKDQCYQYNDCRSVISNNYSICSAIGNSKQCTTDGSNCIPINKCASTPIKGCFYGIEKECVVNLNTEGQQKCEVYTSCSQLKYTTHSLCNSIRSNCTVNSDGHCMDLQASCDAYITSESCQITSSAISCFWDTITKACRNRVCSDLLFSSHSQCNAVDKTCTTDNSKCMVMPTCSELKTQEVCRFGTDGDCMYNASTGDCRLKLCSDYTSDLTLCKAKAGCVATSTECLSQATCSQYVTQESCKNDGTDGVCTWYNEACKLMASCTEAGSFETACKKKSDVCKWTPKPSNGGSSSCKAYTCSTKSEVSKCLPLPTFDGLSYQVCTEVQGKCTESSVSSLSSQSTCSSQSAQTYYWNSGSKKCVACNPDVTGTVVDKTIFDVIVKISIISILAAI